MKSRSRSLRRNSTPAESILWQRLRNRRLHGYKFRRQVPVGAFIADFLCEDAAVIVELDGGQHQTQMDYDQARSERLAGYGFQVIRYWNNDVLSKIEAVLEDLLSTLQEQRPPKAP